MKALVTGANGFLGSYLVEDLVDRGYEVTAMTRKPFPTLTGPTLSNVQGDVRNLDALRDATKNQDVVFHTAGISGIWGPWKLYHGTNTIGTRNVVTACLENKVKKLVYTSSPSVVFNGQHQVHVDESTPYPKTWLCHYPHSKALAEQHVLDANDNAGLMTCALRPHLIWGPRDRHLIPRLLDRAREKKLVRVGDGSNLVDNIYVENAAYAHVQAAEAMHSDSPVCGSAYFLSQGEPVSLWGWINEILQLAGLPRVKKSITFHWAYRLGFALETAYEMCNLQGEPRMTRFLAAQLGKSHYYDISRAKRDFNYYPRISTIAGMKKLGETFGDPLVHTEASV